MKSFIYKAKSGPDKIIEGKIAAASTHEVVEMLTRKGYVATFVKEEVDAKKSTSRFSLRWMFGARLKEIMVFSRQLAHLLRAGVPILRALHILSEQTNNTYFAAIIDDIAEKVKKGQTFSLSLKAYPKHFSSFYIAMIKAGEDSGGMDKALQRISEYYSKQLELQSKVKSALSYPLFIVVVGFVSILFIFTNVMPRIIPLFTGLNVALPLPTQILISMSNFLRQYWFAVVLCMALFILIFKRAMNNKAFQRSISVFKLKLPLFGPLIFKSEFSRFARALEMALHSGIPIIRAIDISIPILSEYIIKESLTASLQELESGGSFSRALKNAQLFPPFILNLVSVGEESGRLYEALSDIADSYKADCEEAVRVLTTLLEPAMVLVIGLIVGFIVSAVLLPIFQLNFMRL
ncbi:type II secretion system F family protein [Candidatus Omnitrophota bacterium]